MRTKNKFDNFFIFASKWNAHVKSYCITERQSIIYQEGLCQHLPCHLEQTMSRGRGFEWLHGKDIQIGFPHHILPFSYTRMLKSCLFRVTYQQICILSNNFNWKGEQYNVLNIWTTTLSNTGRTEMQFLFFYCWENKFPTNLFCC